MLVHGYTLCKTALSLRLPYDLVKAFTITRGILAVVR
jgi:hypothetical protein